MSNLRFDQIIFKASHNSYERNESISEQLSFHANSPYNCGCMALEFDIWRHSSDFTPGKEIKKDYFTVAHTTPGSKPLASYFEGVLSWHKNNPNHDVVLITLDIKSSGGGYSHFHEEIDTYLKCYLGENLIYKPTRLIRNTSLSLCENVTKYGWPVLSSPELKNKFIICLSGNEDWKSEYSRSGLDKLFCFCDADKSASDIDVYPPTKGNIVFFNFHIYDNNRDAWMNSIPRFASRKLITRTYVTNSEKNWNNCIKANVSAIATDKVSNHEWCKFGSNNLFQEKKKSYDKRFIKNKSNNEYRTSNATKMQDTYRSPESAFIFEEQEGSNIFAIRNAKNNEYFDSTITSMSDKVIDDRQRWELISVDASRDEFYLRNCNNNEYMTKKASKLSDNCGEDEVYIIQSVD